MPRAQARPRPTTILFVRHGNTPTTGKLLPGRAPGLHLSDTGREQARATAAALAGMKQIDAIYSSPLERARETAAPIAEVRGLKIKIEKGLVELDVGDWTGEELKKVARTPEWRIVQRYPSGFRFPAGESFFDAQARIVGTIQRLVSAHPGGVVVAVSHADPIKAAVANAMGTHLDLFQRVSISPASVTTVAYGEGGPMVLGVNWVPAPGAVKPS